jgi:hypothetical protein
MGRLLGLLSISITCLTLSCARENPGARAPQSGFAPWIAPPAGHPSRTASRQNRFKPGAEALARSQLDPITTPFRAPLLSDFALPGGEACLSRLRTRGISARPIDVMRGVDTPVVVVGPIGGVRFWSSSGPLIVDCRFALGLHEVASDFAALGIESARFSGAYVYRTSRKGRLSLHAYGLAMDLHELRTAWGVQTVKRNFLRGTGESCGADEPIPNQLACRLRRRGLFRELLTPDYNSDHHDHLHLGIAPLPTSAAVRRTFEVSSPKLTGKDRPGKRGAQVKPSGQRERPPSVRVEPVRSRPRVAGLGTDLKDAPEVSTDLLEFSATNPPSQLLPIETQRPEVLDGRLPEVGGADAPIAGRDAPIALDGDPKD